jgi:hypothetical protein
VDGLDGHIEKEGRGGREGGGGGGWGGQERKSKSAVKFKCLVVNP